MLYCMVWRSLISSSLRRNINRNYQRHLSNESTNYGDIRANSMRLPCIVLRLSLLAVAQPTALLLRMAQCFLLRRTTIIREQRSRIHQSRTVNSIQTTTKIRQNMEVVSEHTVIPVAAWTGIAAVMVFSSLSENRSSTIILKLINPRKKGITNKICYL